MSNKNWHRHLKRKIHKNRWLIWAVAYMLIVALGLVGYIAVSEIDFEREVVPYQNSETWRSYRDGRLAFSLRFPQDWGIEAQQNSVIFDGPNWGEEISVSVGKISDETLLRQSLKIIKEEKIKIDGVSAVKLTNSLGQGADESVVLAKHNNKLYIIRGSNSFNRIFSTFNFLEVTR
jgi:hypothetical protein